MNIELRTANPEHIVNVEVSDKRIVWKQTTQPIRRMGIASRNGHFKPISEV